MIILGIDPGYAIVGYGEAGNNQGTDTTRILRPLATGSAPGRERV